MNCFFFTGILIKPLERDRMLIIDKFQLAYLHINKTAGTSIKGYFEEHLGQENIKQMGPTHGP